MLKGMKKEHIYIVCGHTDMRKSIDGLAAIIQCQFSLDLYQSVSVLRKAERPDERIAVGRKWLSSAV